MFFKKHKALITLDINVAPARVDEAGKAVRPAEEPATKQPEAGPARRGNGAADGAPVAEAGVSPAVAAEPAALAEPAPGEPVPLESAPAEETAGEAGETPAPPCPVESVVPGKVTPPAEDAHFHEAPTEARAETGPVPEEAPGEPPSAPAEAASPEPALFGGGEEAERISCPFCFKIVLAGSEKCEFCGNSFDAGLPVEMNPPRPAPPESPLEVVEPQPPEPPEQEAEEMPEPITRRLSTLPTPSILKETTIMLPAKLTLLDTTSLKAEDVFVVRIGTTNIGRGTDNELSFPEEEFISRRHCQIAFHKYQYVLKDLQSANGTYVNDVRIQETILRDGDHIQVGSLRFLFEDPIEKMKKKHPEES